MNKSEALKNLTSYGDEDEYLDEENNKEKNDEKNNDYVDDDIDGKPMDEDYESGEKILTQITYKFNENLEEKRKILREIEVRNLK